MPDQVLFYCHFPDLLLARRRSALHAAYRQVLDAIEEASTGQAHRILVNSRFTQGMAVPVDAVTGCEASPLKAAILAGMRCNAHPCTIFVMCTAWLGVACCNSNYHAWV